LDSSDYVLLSHENNVHAINSTIQVEVEGKLLCFMILDVMKLVEENVYLEM
jgi:hypothetical protein